MNDSFILESRDNENGIIYPDDIYSNSPQSNLRACWNSIVMFNQLGHLFSVPVIN